MDVSLPPELEQFIAETISSGQYSSPSEVVRASLQSFQQEQLWNQHARDKIARGLDDLEAGRVVGGQTFLHNLRQQIRDRDA